MPEAKMRVNALDHAPLISGRPALFKACLKWRMKFLGEIGPPVLVVKMSPDFFLTAQGASFAPHRRHWEELRPVLNPLSWVIFFHSGRCA
jgi:hypothetical protein